MAIGSGWTLRTPGEGPLLTPTAPALRRRRLVGRGCRRRRPAPRLVPDVVELHGGRCVPGDDLDPALGRHGLAGTARPRRLAGLRCHRVVVPDRPLVPHDDHRLRRRPRHRVDVVRGPLVGRAGALPASRARSPACPARHRGRAWRPRTGSDPQVHELAGGAWTPVHLAGLGLGSSARLADVDCTAPGECVVVGDAGYVDGVIQGAARHAGRRHVDVDGPSRCRRDRRRLLVGRRLRRGGVGERRATSRRGTGRRGAGSRTRRASTDRPA